MRIGSEIRGKYRLRIGIRIGVNNAELIVQGRVRNTIGSTCTLQVNELKQIGSVQGTLGLIGS